MNQSLTEKEAIALQKEFPFTWVEKELKYLGIKLTTSLDKMYQANYFPLLNEIISEIKKISIRLLSWMGRINMIKLAILTKIVQKFQMIPIALSQNFLRILQKMSLKCIWQDRKPRIQYAILN